ncbi:hypothetical protein BAUCODRAFT_72427 [Baudoinia panamericana UAMH 10762]|uniref:HMG box domain-containing protein n=1 Tax=Baudoinia panamericana (strain UAMH 10762) TaxID=717646 RepID=M2N8G7_BAUPA|nr:uncharacterized protein BAUCODRAFT_72427 [Baudoinia panamericana UAMH 10762]EMC95394.1 hypothetical protein BAUCODRAFT_72427 [Baudoinia panamericana UAMH 10762]
MSDGNGSEQGALDKAQHQDSHESNSNEPGPSRRTSSTVSTRSQRRSPNKPGGNKTPLTPEESPPFKVAKKRTAGVIDGEDEASEDTSATPTHSRGSSGEATHVCICQPDPRIPRPRNAFILYRQHHQAQVASQHPGLANPEISKIIGEQWQSQLPEVKNRWKGLAEEEKLRHQQQYPTYRYQPKRNGRRNSISSDPATGEKPKCAKCGGRNILSAPSPFAQTQVDIASPSSLTLASASTPISRTLPVLKDLNLQSPATQGMGRAFPGSSMSPTHNGRHEDRDDLGPLNSDVKRRRYNGEHPQSVTRVIPPRYGLPPPPPSIHPVGPGTPFPFRPAGVPPHPFASPTTHVHRESLPGLRGVVNVPGPMAAPPRPGIGYQQHRMSQGLVGPDRSLTLPPLQTGSITGASGAANDNLEKTAEEQIMAMSFRYKVKVLSQVAPPAPVNGTSRGALIAVEGDDRQAVAELGKWLHEELKKGVDLAVTLFDSPDISADDREKEPMRQCHLLAAAWLLKSDDILAAISHKSPAALTDSVMQDVTAAADQATVVHKLFEYRDDSEEVVGKAVNEEAGDSDKEQSAPDELMDVGKTPMTSKPATVNMAADPNVPAKLVGLVANYSLHASNVLACRIPIGPHDPYSPSDHWQWTATQWRGIIGPDLTIYLRDAVVGDNGKATVEILEEGNLFVAKRTHLEGGKGLELEASVLRRLGFEVGEWVRGFGAAKSA